MHSNVMYYVTICRKNVRQLDTISPLCALSGVPFVTSSFIKLCPFVNLIVRTSTSHPPVMSSLATATRLLFPFTQHPPRSTCHCTLPINESSTHWKTSNLWTTNLAYVTRPLATVTAERCVNLEITLSNIRSINVRKTMQHTTTWYS